MGCSGWLSVVVLALVLGVPLLWSWLVVCVGRALLQQTPLMHDLHLQAGLRQSLASSYGASKTDSECRADHSENDARYLSGEWEPTFSTGSPEECDTPGCTDGFWGPRSRFKEEPTCPKELVRGLTKWLRDLGSQGSDWAKKALILQRCDLWMHFRGRTTWVIGDSVTEDVGHAMSSFMLEYWDKEHWEVTLTSDERIKAALDHGAAEGVHKGGRRVPFWCFQMGSREDPGRMCYLKADRAKRMLHVLNVLPHISEPEDIMLINLGIHYNEMDDLAEDMMLVGFALGNPALPKHRIWLETSPQHYETPTGMFNMSRPIKEQLCYPPGHFQGTNISVFANGSVGVAPGAVEPHPGSHKEISLQRLLAGGERNLATQPIIDSLGLPTMRVWNISLTLYQFHTHVHLPGEGECTDIQCDCTHVCHPSWPQVVMANFVHIMENQTPTRHFVD